MIKGYNIIIIAQCNKLLSNVDIILFYVNDVYELDFH